MMITDPVADLLTRIRNAVTAHHDKVEIPASRLKANLVKVLKDEGYIRNFRLMRDSGRPMIKVYLKYDDAGQAIIQGIRRISRPGLRVYSSYDKVRAPLGGAGITVLSTSQGLMTSQKARNAKLGGEVLCEVW